MSFNSSDDKGLSNVINLLNSNSTNNIEDDDDDDDYAREPDVILKRSNTVYKLEQFPCNVFDFSSQYGSDYSISYTALNIIGRLTKYPEYGDFPETYAMRTYGKWWQVAPSGMTEFQMQNFPKIPADDFIVLGFENFTIPRELTIFETFNPGAVIRIWAYTLVRTWICLWEAEPESLDAQLPHMSRAFNPQLKKIRFPVKILRLEFNHSKLKYLTEIDSLILSGHSVDMRYIEESIRYYEMQKRTKGSILRVLNNIKFKPMSNNNENAWQQFLKNDLNKFVGKHVIDGSTADCDPEQKHNKREVEKSMMSFNQMPFDIVLKIFSYLDLLSLFRAGQVSRFFYEVSLSPTLYMELNLKPYWNLATNDMLGVLAKRATVLKKLDLSWCGLFNTISPTEFKKFIQQRGDTLTHLRLQSCKFLNATCIETLAIACDNLKELSLRNCVTDPPLLNFSCLANLKNLERLDLLQTIIEPELLFTMLEANPKLKHLNLAFSGVAVDMDEVAHHISMFNKQLVSLDMWKSHFLTAAGIKALRHCHDLEEVDIGWCLREASLGDSLKELVMNCPKLKKLFLCTARGITDSDVQYIANYCPNLEQLDLMGVIGISKERYHELFVNCSKLQLIDLSFCDNVSENDRISWESSFPNVEIKCSHLLTVEVGSG